MKKPTIVIVGIVLAVLGAAGLALGSVSWTEEEVLLDAGPLQASATVERERRIPPLVAGSVMALGLALAVYGTVRRD